MANKPILQDSITDVWTYLISIDWEQPWLYMLLSFHVWCMVITVLAVVYRAYYPQVALFSLYLGLAFCSEYINKWAAANYQLFSSEQYFDSHGMFISLLFSFPLLCNTLVIVVYWMWDLTQSMILLKRAKVRQSIKAKKAVQEGEKEEQVNVKDGEKAEQVGDGQLQEKTEETKEVEKTEEIEEGDTMEESEKIDEVEQMEETKEKTSTEKKDD